MNDEKLDIDIETERGNEKASPEEVSVKDQIYLLIAAIKESVWQEIYYFKARTDYSIAIIIRAFTVFFIALLFIMVAFMSLGVGILFILKPMVGIIMATILTVAIFLSLSLAMALWGRSYLKKLAFPELAEHEKLIEDVEDE